MGPLTEGPKSNLSQWLIWSPRMKQEPARNVPGGWGVGVDGLKLNEMFKSNPVTHLHSDCGFSLGKIKALPTLLLCRLHPRASW